MGLASNFRASESRSQACLDYAERSRKSQREKRTFKNVCWPYSKLRKVLKVSIYTYFNPWKNHSILQPFFVSPWISEQKWLKDLKIKSFSTVQQRCSHASLVWTLTTNMSMEIRKDRLQTRRLTIQSLELKIQIRRLKNQLHRLKSKIAAPLLKDLNFKSFSLLFSDTQ